MWKSCGWLSKLWSLFGYPKYQVPYYNRDPKRDHNFDNHPYRDDGKEHGNYVLRLRELYLDPLKMYRIVAILAAFEGFWICESSERF